MKKEIREYLNLVDNIIRTEKEISKLESKNLESETRKDKIEIEIIDFLKDKTVKGRKSVSVDGSVFVLSFIEKGDKFYLDVDEVEMI